MLRSSAYLITLLPLIFLTTGCGGSGSGSDSNPPAVTVTPSPTPTPTPSPPPPPTAASVTISSIGAPAIATAPANPVSPQASAGGPTFFTQPTPSITFPVLQSTLAISNNTLVADLATMDAGGSFDFAYCVGCRPTFALTVSGAGISQASLNTFADSPFSARLPDGREIFVEEATWGFSDLASVMFGYWEVGKPFPSHHSGYVYGYESPASALPTSGTLTYTGRVVGRVFSPTVVGGPATAIHVFGNATVQVDFAARTVTGQLLGMRTGPNDPFNVITFSASFASGTIQSTGTTATTASAGGVALGGSATGTVAARFYGANGRELGLVWTLYDGTRAAIGSAGMRN